MNQTIEAQKAVAIEKLLELQTIITDNEIVILGTKYEVTRVGKFLVQLTGERGAGYSVTVCAKSVVMGNKDLTAFALVSNMGVLVCNFTIHRNKTEQLYK